MLRLKPFFLSLPIFLLTFLLFLHPIVDFSQDLGRHIKLGEIIVQTHAVPKTNLFSYTYPNFPFINHHWFSEVIFYYLNLLFGPSGILICTSALAALSMALLFIFVLKKSNLFTVFISSCLYLCILLSRTYLRPEIFSFFFMSMFVVILYKNQEKFSRLILVLPILELLWVNMHIYFVVGPLLVFIFIINAIIPSITNVSNAKLAISNLCQPKSYILLLVFMFTCLATILNPNGLTGALYPLHVFSNYSYTIEENQSVLFLINYGWWYPWFTAIFAASGIFVILLLYYRRTTSLADWLIFVTFTYLAFQMERNFPLFVIGTFILFVRLISPFSTAIDRQFVNKKSLLLTGKIILCAIGISYLLFFNIRKFGFGISIMPSAEKGVDFFIAQKIKGPIFNNFDIGSYLDYRLYPQEKVFVDGRPEAYPADFFLKIYEPMQENPTFFHQEDTTYHFQAIFLSYADQTPWGKTFIQNIIKDPQWQLVYLDHFSLILVKKEGINAQIAKKFAVNEDNFSLSQLNSYPLEDYYHFAYFFQLVGWQKKILEIAQKILILNPRDCSALGILAQSPQMQAIYSQRYFSACQ